MKRKSRRPIKFHLYKIQYADKYEEVRFFPADEVKENGGVEALEVTLKNDAAWFAPLGDVYVRPDRRGDVNVEFAAIDRLSEAWAKKGSPKIIGKGRGASPMA